MDREQRRKIEDARNEHFRLIIQFLPDFIQQCAKDAKTAAPEMFPNTGKSEAEMFRMLNAVGERIGNGAKLHDLNIDEVVILLAATRGIQIVIRSLAEDLAERVVLSALGTVGGKH